MSLNVVLVEPEIPWNTGNIGRSCVGAGAALHLVGTLGFSLSERRIRRSGLDYWPRLRLSLHESWEAFEQALPGGASLLLFTPDARRSFWEVPFPEDAYLVFGKESAGLPPQLLRRHAEKTVRIPMADGERSLNLSTAAGIALYEGLRRMATKTTTAECMLPI